MLLSNAFNSIREINRLTKEINGLLSKGMSNIYWTVTIETFSKLRFVTGSFFLQVKNQMSGSNLYMDFILF